MSTLVFSYDCKIDDKGRVLLPTKLKGELASYIPDGFIIKRSVFFSCIEFWPKSEWEKESTLISNLNRFNPENVEFIRKYLAGLKPIELDSTGRLLIPKDLIAFAGIEKDIVLIGTGDRIEIWDKIKYEAALSGGSPINELAMKILGGQAQKPIL